MAQGERRGMREQLTNLARLEQLDQVSFIHLEVVDVSTSSRLARKEQKDKREGGARRREGKEKEGKGPARRIFIQRPDVDGVSASCFFFLVDARTTYYTAPMGKKKVPARTAHTEILGDQGENFEISPATGDKITN